MIIFNDSKMIKKLVIGLLLIWTVHGSVDEESMVACHTGDRFGLWCDGYVSLVIHENEEVTLGPSERWVEHKRSKRAGDMMDMMDSGMMDDMMDMMRKPDQSNGNTTGIDFPELDDECFETEWGNGTGFNRENNYGNCMEMSENGTHRFISTNSVPDYPVAPYCPNGIGESYCSAFDRDPGNCPLQNLFCGHPDNGIGTTSFGDVPVPKKHYFVIPLEGDPTRPDRPGDMFDAVTIGAAKTLGPALGVVRNGVPIHGPNDGGDVTIDKGGYQLACGAHTTPPLANNVSTLHKGTRNPPTYHYHKAPDCILEYRQQAWGLAFDGTPNKHAPLVGWAIDGFGIYGYEDVKGEKPVVDECGGHFGPTDTGEVVYHYHTRTDVPYYIACQGPAVGKCSDTQKGYSFCGTGCGFEVCIQPGTSEEKLEKYLGKWEAGEGWLAKYTHNPYNSSSYMSTTLTVTMAMVWVINTVLAQ